MSTNKENLALRLCASILQKNGSIAISDIRALPFLDEDFDTTPIKEHLLSSFNAKLTQKKIQSYPVSSWDEIITIEEE